MEFTVHFADGVESATTYPEGSKFHIKDNGVLKVAGPDELTTHYAPGSWLTVSHRTPDTGRPVVAG